jgi:hypothetical protein
MAFTTGYLGDPQKVGAGERFGNNNTILSAANFEDGLTVGVFAGYDSTTDTIVNMTATAVVAGVVLRNAASPVEDGATVDATLYSSIDYMRQGLVTVRVTAGEAPEKFGAVFADTGTGQAMTAASATAVATNAEFLEEIQDGVWLIHMAGL